MTWPDVALAIVNLIQVVYLREVLHRTKPPKASRPRRRKDTERPAE